MKLYLNFLFLLVCSVNSKELEFVDFSASKFTVQVNGETREVLDTEDFAFLIPHENDLVSFECLNGAPG